MNDLEPQNPHRRGIQCPEHGLHFNPETNPGCVLCLREKKRGNGLQLVIMTLLLVAAAVTVTWSLREDTNRASPGTVEASSSVSVDGEEAYGDEYPPVPVWDIDIAPEPYREKISAIENILYRQSPPDYSDPSSAASLAVELSEEIREREPRMVLAQATSQLLGWASMVDASSSVGFSAPDLTRSRQDWEQLRSELFEPAPWFRQSDANLRNVQQPPPPEINRATVAALRLASRNIHHLITFGEPESKAIGEVASDNQRDPNVVEARRKWESWSRQWRRKVEDAASSLPDRPSPTSNLNLIMAYQTLGSALYELRTMDVSGNDYGVPFAYQRQARFNTARLHIKEAEEYLAKLP